MALEPVRRLPLKEQAKRQLLALIEEGSLQPGDRLPPERELSERLGVSRGTVREAVQFMQALGILEVRHGSGTVVSQQLDDRHALRALWRSWTMEHVGRVRELLEVRRGLDVFAAELASRRQIPAALEEMAGAIDQMRTALREVDVTMTIQADLLFHRAVGEASGNVALTELLDSIGQQLLRERAAVASASPARPKRSLDEHTAIYEAILAGDADRARAAALQHLESVERDIVMLADDPGPEDRDGGGDDDG